MSLFLNLVLNKDNKLLRLSVCISRRAAIGCCVCLPGVLCCWLLIGCGWNRGWLAGQWRCVAVDVSIVALPICFGYRCWSARQICNNSPNLVYFILFFLIFFRQKARPKKKGLWFWRHCGSKKCTGIRSSDIAETRKEENISNQPKQNYCDFFENCFCPKKKFKSSKINFFSKNQKNHMKPSAKVSGVKNCKMIETQNMRRTFYRRQHRQLITKEREDRIFPVQKQEKLYNSQKIELR